MQFHHILAEDITEREGELLDKARLAAYDEIEPDQLGFLIRDRYLDAWRLEGAEAIMLTSFEVDSKGQDLMVNYFAGHNCARVKHEISRAIVALAKKLGCRSAVFMSRRDGFMTALEVDEVARLYRLRD